jgi:hypothetical protein
MSGSQINIPPPMQRQGFTATQAASQQQHQQRIQPVTFFSGLKEPPSLFWCQVSGFAPVHG